MYKSQENRTEEKSEKLISDTSRVRIHDPSTWKDQDRAANFLLGLYQQISKGQE